ncbi:MAG TPA: rod shape-determining protein [Campylobacterales bacterium]|nr:rod shape-determining protein [Campylobacterales bacterium]
MLLDKLFGLFSNDLSIDLGTANTIVIAKGKGIIINEPSVVAIKKNRFGKKRMLAVGKDAKEMLGKTPENIEAIRPLKDGVIADFDVAEEMIRHFIKKAHNRNSFIRPRVIICVPYGLTQVERKAVKDSAFSAGARDVILVEEPKAAAIGSGLPVKEPKGNMVIDIGGGTTEIGVISLDGLVRSKSIKVGGDRFDQNIIDYMKRKYNLLIGERTGEEIKIEVGTAVPLEKELTMRIKGRDQLSGLLKEIEITSVDVRESIAEPLAEIGTALKEILEVTPPDLAGDIVENGIALTGGGALLKGIDVYLSKLVELPVFVCEDPLLAVARGTGAMLEDIELLQQAQ